MTMFLRVLEVEDKETALREVLCDRTAWKGQRWFQVEPRDFRKIPGSPIAYWIGGCLRAAFSSNPQLENVGRTARKGLCTDDDFRFIRAWWELDAKLRGHRWPDLAKGGAHSAYYSDVHLAIEWNNSGAILKAKVAATYGSAGKRVYNEAFYLRPGLTWPIKNRFSFKPWPLPQGCMFSHISPTAFLDGDTAQALHSLQAVMSSAVFTALVRAIAGWNFEVGVIQLAPIPQLMAADGSKLAAVARRAWSLKRSLDTRTDNSHAFNLPALLQSPTGTLTARAAGWADRVYATETELAAIQAEIDDRCFDLYGINDQDRKAITEGFGGAATAPTDEASVEASDDSEPDESESSSADTAALTAELLAWSVGVAFGRFDIRLATGERALPPEPEPFDPLPVCSPGMLSGTNGLPLAAPPAGYPIAFPQDGVLVDDPGHPRDLFAAARAVFDTVFGNDADARWQEAAGILDPKNHDLRTFLARTFFEQHIKRYSKSRRKAPIYWQLATPSASYSIWLYAHRLTRDTFFHLLNEVVTPKLEHEERKLLSLVQEHGPNPTASQRKASAAQEAFVEELRAFRDEIARVVPLWKPDPDDGVLLTMAPLWRLIPQHRAWQKELKTAWDSLCAGDYDWAHLAMHLWPERVVSKCATDRSLAIAHGLEEVFWEEGANGKWTARKTPLTPISELVTGRTSPAVKAALKELLDAPVTGGATKAGRRGKTPVRGSDTG